MSSPNTFVMVCAGVKCDKSYNHVLLFNNESARFSYFQGKAVKTFDRYTYQRVDKYLTVGCNAEDIEPANYVVFRNSAFSEKVYYAFIERVEYVADNTSRIYFTIDVMQTWFPSTTINPCFIERMHATRDYLGDNIVDDNLDCGEYVDSIESVIGYPVRITFLTTFDAEYNDAYGTLENGLYTGLQTHKFSSASEANSFISGAVAAGKSDGIVSCFMSPLMSDKISDVEVRQISSVNGYNPRNRKLLTYPYSYIHVYDNTKKVNAVFKQEFFKKNGSVILPVIGISMTDGQGSPEIGVVPKNYKLDNSILTENYNYNEAVYGKPFPICAYNIDIYKAYMAQNASSVAVENMGMVMSGVKAAGNILGMIGAGNIGEAVSRGASAINEGLSIASTMAKRDDMDRLPPQTNGNPSTSLAYILNGRDEFIICHRTITAEYARMIDNYWSVYGYPIREVITPNITSRRNWNYIKTGNSCIQGTIPPAELRMINDIFNRGVTFWHNPETVGNYSLDNSIVR